MHTNFSGNLKGKKSLRRLRLICENNIKSDFTATQSYGEDYIDLVQNKEQRKHNALLDFIAGEFTDQVRDYYSLRKDSAHGISSEMEDESRGTVLKNHNIS
jgi:hypothetical protein